MKYTKIALFLAAMAIFGRWSDAAAQIAIVVNKNNATSNLSIGDLKKIYLGKITVFSTGQKIALFEYASVKTKFYEQVLDMKVDKVKKHWFSVVFSGKSATPPKEIKNVEEVKKLVNQNDGAICFVEHSKVDSSTMKVLTIDGKKPGDAKYRLK